MDFKELYVDTCSSVSIAAKNGYLEALKSLLSKGRASCLGDNRGWRALHHAAFNGHLDCVKVLLEASDVDINATTFERQTSLYLVCSSNLDPELRLSIAKLLLESGADPNVENKNQYITILNEAILRNCPALIKLLIDYKVNVNEIDDKYGSALNVVAETGSLAILELLLKQRLVFKPSVRDSCVFLHIAIKSHFGADVTLLKMFLKKPECLALINHQDSTGCSALGNACCVGWIKAVSLLLDYGADPNIRNGAGDLPLNLAAMAFPDLDPGLEDSVLLKLYKLTCRSEIKKTRESLGSSLFHSIVATGNKKNMLSIMMDVSQLSPNDFSLPLDGITLPMCNFGDYFLYEEFLWTPLALWCANPTLASRSDLGTLHLLMKDVDDLNDYSKGNLPPLVASVFCLEQCSLPVGQGDVIRHLIQSGADVMVKIDPSLPLPTIFMMMLYHERNQCLEVLLVHSVPASAFFNDQTLPKLVEFVRLNCTLQCYAPAFLGWIECIERFVPRLPKDTSKILAIISKFSNFHEIKKRLKVINQMSERPKNLRHLSILRIRSALYESRKDVCAERAIRDLCAQVRLPPALSKILMFDMEHTVGNT